MVFGIASLEITNESDTRQIVADVIENSATPKEYSQEMLYEYLQSVDSTYARLEEDVSQIEGVFGWSCGGGIPLIHTESGTYVAIYYNEEQDDLEPFTFTYPSGISSSWNELGDIRMASLRNTIQNLLISTDDKWLLPKSDSEVLSDSHIRHLLSERYSKAESQIQKTPSQISQTPFSVTSQPLGSDTIKIDYDNMVRTVNGKLVIDLQKNIVTLIELIHINLSDYTVSELNFCDGAVTENGELRNRSIHLVKLREIQDVIEGYVNSTYVFQSNEIKGRNSMFEEKHSPELIQSTKQLIEDMSPKQNL